MLGDAAVRVSLQTVFDGSNQLGIRTAVPAKRAMNLVGSGLRKNATGVLLVDPSSRHDDESAARLLDKSLNQGNALLCRRSLTRREQAVTT